MAVLKKETMTHSIFKDLGLADFPIMLAPLAGVSDAPFRQACTEIGACDLSFVEMLSASALIYRSERSLAMMAKYPGEQRVGVQITGRTPHELARAVAVINSKDFKVIDINMGCPVRKVVKVGCGSAIIRDPEKAHQMVLAARRESAVPVTAKIRIGWDHSSINDLEVADAVQSAGASWLTVHGRARSDDYSVPVYLDRIRAVKNRLRIPVIANGNIFGFEDAHFVREQTGVDGLMVARGALGNPWVFRRIADSGYQTTLSEWSLGVRRHLDWQMQAFGDCPRAAIPLRKQLLWYCKGWPHAKGVRESLSQVTDLSEAARLFSEFAQQLERLGVKNRADIVSHDPKKFFI